MLLSLESNDVTIVDHIPQKQCGDAEEGCAFFNGNRERFAAECRHNAPEAVWDGDKEMAFLGFLQRERNRDKDSETPG